MAGGIAAVWLFAGKSRYMAQFSGVSTYATAETLIRDYQLPITIEQLMDKKTARFLALLQTELPVPMPGAEALLQKYSKQNWPWRW